jgi:hypothetical protein
MKRDFGAHFKPIYSKMVPLTPSFAAALRTKELVARRFLRANGPDSVSLAIGAGAAQHDTPGPVRGP